MDIYYIFKDNEVSIIATNLNSTPTCDVRAAGNKKLYNSLATDKNLINNVDSLDEKFINL